MRASLRTAMSTAAGSARHCTAASLGVPPSMAQPAAFAPRVLLPSTAPFVSVALNKSPTITTVTAPITLCQRNATSGIRKFTKATSDIPAINPKNDPRPVVLGIIARMNTPRMDP